MLHRVRHVYARRSLGWSGATKTTSQVVVNAVAVDSPGHVAGTRKAKERTGLMAHHDQGSQACPSPMPGEAGLASADDEAADRAFLAASIGLGAKGAAYGPTGPHQVEADPVLRKALTAGR